MFNKSKIIIPKGNKYIALFLCVMVLSTALHFRDNMSGLFSECSKIMIMPMYLILAFGSGQVVFAKLLSKLKIIYSITLIADVIVQILELMGVKIYDEQIYSILGMDNYAAFSVLPMLVMIFYISYKMNNKITVSDVILYFSCLIAKIATFSFTAVLALLTVGVIIFVSIKDKKMRMIISPQFIVFVTAVLIIGVVYAGMALKLDFLFEGTGKSLSTRTSIWTHTVKSLPGSPIIGFGKTTGDQFKMTTGLTTKWKTTLTHPHNYILSILFSTGIIGFLLYIGIYSQLIKIIRRNINDKYSAIVLGGVVGFLILAIPDGYPMLPPIYTLLTIIYLDNKNTLMALRKKRIYKQI